MASAPAAPVFLTSMSPRGESPSSKDQSFRAGIFERETVRDRRCPKVLPCSS